MLISKTDLVPSYNVTNFLSSCYKGICFYLESKNVRKLRLP